MPADFRMEQHGPRKLRTTALFGIVFGTLSDATPDIETFAGPGVIERLRTAADGRKLEIIGRFTEVLPNNWKLYAENVRDTYHASLLHLFFATFKLNRLSQGGGTQINETGSCHVSTTLAPDQAVDTAYDGMRSVDDDYRLNDPSLLDAVDEHGDRVRQQIISVFPTFVMQRTQNVMAVRHFLPRGPDKTDLHWIFLGYADDTPEQRTPPAAADESRRTGGLCLHGGRLHRRLRRTRRGRGDGANLDRRNGRPRHRKPGHPRDRGGDPRASGASGANWSPFDRSGVVA